MSATHHVHIYTTIRVKVAVTAEDHVAAMKKADEIFIAPAFPIRFIRASAEILDVEPAEEVTGYLIDETDDPDFERSCFYDAGYVPTTAKLPDRQA
jgi:hypothetical protein